MLNMDIIEVLQSYAPIENWTLLPAQDFSNETRTLPPILCWTSAELLEDTASALTQAITSYEGEVQWDLQRAFEVRADGKRWVLMPMRVRQHIDQTGGTTPWWEAADELRKTDPEFGRRAHADLRKLAYHLYAKLGEAMVTHGA